MTMKHHVPTGSNNSLDGAQSVQPANPLHESRNRRTDTLEAIDHLSHTWIVSSATYLVYSICDSFVSLYLFRNNLWQSYVIVLY